MFEWSTATASCQSLRSSTVNEGTALWNPPTNASLALTLFGEDESHPKKKLWNIVLVGKFEDEKDVVLGKTVIDVAEKLHNEVSETFEIPAGKCPKSSLHAKVVTDVESSGEGDGDDADGEGKKKKKKRSKIPLKSQNSCVLLLGITGAGKTTTINIFTGNNLATGSEAHSITDKTTLCKDLIHPNGPAWIDNPGWSDTTGRSDSEMFKDLLRFLQDRKIYNLIAVIWCVLPQPRMDAVLQAQAKFIHMFTMGKEEGKIWNNVLIVAKAGKTSAEDCLGAKMAAKKCFVHAEPKTLSYELCVDEEVLSGTTATMRKEKLKLLTKEEIRGELELQLKEMKEVVPVVFANQRCLDCGQTGDPRLMEDKCHKEKYLGHTGELVQRFPKAQVALSVLGSVAGAIGLGTMAGVAPGSEAALAAMPAVLAPGVMLTLHRLLNKESSEESQCIHINDMRYTCCRKGEKAKGCTVKCNECDAIWGNPPPCVLIKHPDLNAADAMEEYEVFKREHDLVECEVGGEAESESAGVTQPLK